MRSKWLLTVSLALCAGASHAEVKTKTVTYEYEGVTFKGHLAWDDAAKGKRPGILVVHEWWGLNDYARRRAEQLAGMGYVAFAADMYGAGKTTEHPEEAGKFASEVRKNIKVWQGRAQAALMSFDSQNR
jgi:dienelactone hydrolase